LQDEFAVVVTRAFWFPQFIGCDVRIFTEIQASVGVGARGMDGAD
jgi:hypothetical protein